MVRWTREQEVHISLIYLLEKMKIWEIMQHKCLFSMIFLLESFFLEMRLLQFSLLHSVLKLQRI